MKIVTFLKTHTLINTKLIKDINSMQEDYNDFIESVNNNECCFNLRKINTKVWYIIIKRNNKLYKTIIRTISI